VKNYALAHRLRGMLAGRQLANGGWPGLSISSQAALETTALAHLALRPGFDSVLGRATTFFLKTQNPNGSWPAFLGDDQDGSWTTSLGLIALQENIEALPQRLKGLKWLVGSAGKESDWLWRWKFRTADRHVRFDPDKFGWPWLPHTNSWVVPTAFAILALNQFPCACALGDAGGRTELGIEMLLDRACPGGGWNAGNGVVYGQAMTPHPDDTAIALLALAPREKEPIVTRSLDWLEGVVARLTAPWSLAWSILALAAYHRPIDSLVEKLSQWSDLDNVEDISTLAVICLALDYDRALAPFGVPA
jgi:hypothetical protein